MAKVLLVYANPAITASPVPPYGMERIARAFTLAGCEVRMDTPFDDEDPLAAMQEALSWQPDWVGFSVRNIDDALVVRSDVGEGALDIHFYLDEVRPLVQAALQALGPERVLLGGPAIGSGPVPVLDYLGAKWAIRGVAEDLCWALGKQLVAGKNPTLPASDPRVIRIDRDRQPAPHRSPPLPREHMAQMPYLAMGPTPRLGHVLQLTRSRSGRIPVQISVGCDRRCNFCVESRFHGGATVARPVEEILAELSALEKVGVRRIWLSGSELNVPNARHAKELLRRLQGTELDLSVFITAAPVDDELLDLLEGAGINPTGLSFEFGHLDDRLLRAGAGPCNRAQIDQLVELFLRRGMAGMGASVLLGSHPLESEQSLQSAVNAARQMDAAFPRGLGLAYACGARVYPETRLADELSQRWDEVQPDLYTPDGQPPDRSFVRPVVHCRPFAPRTLLTWLREALAGAKGHMGPMNSEAPMSPAELSAERLVNRGIVHVSQGRYVEAQGCFEGALAHHTEHLEALAQLSMLQANHLGDAEASRLTLRRLARVLTPRDPRQAEVQAALKKLGP